MSKYSDVSAFITFVFVAVTLPLFAIICRFHGWMPDLGNRTILWTDHNSLGILSVGLIGPTIIGSGLVAIYSSVFVKNLFDGQLMSAKSEFKIPYPGPVKAICTIICMIIYFLFVWYGQTDRFFITRDYIINRHGLLGQKSTYRWSDVKYVSIDCYLSMRNVYRIKNALFIKINNGDQISEPQFFTGRVNQLNYNDKQKILIDAMMEHNIDIRYNRSYKGC